MTISWGPTSRSHTWKDQIKQHAQESKKHTYTLLLVPRVSTLVSRILEEEGVLGEVTLSPLNLQFIPIADDVISLEHDNAFKELWVVSTKSHSSLPILIQRIGWRRNRSL